MRGTLFSRTMFVSGTAGALTAVRSKARAATFEYKYHHDATVDSAVHIRSVQLWREVERQTNGRLKVTVFPNSQLGTDAAMFTQLKTGAVQFAALSDGTLPAVAPVIGIMQVAFAFHTLDQVQHAIDGPFGDFLRREIEALGTVVMGPGTMIVGFRQVTNSLRPVYRVSDVAGMKLRVTTNILVDLLEIVGREPHSATGRGNLFGASNPPRGRDRLPGRRHRDLPDVRSSEVSKPNQSVLRL